MKSTKLKLLLIFERTLFVLLVIASISPVITRKFFTTVDGPSHTYNALLLNKLIFSPDEKINEYIEINSYFIANWTGHTIQAFMAVFLQPEESEKALVIIYLILFAFSFRYLTELLNGPFPWISYSIFPLMHTTMLYGGMYNYCISLPLILIAITIWIRNNKKFSLSHVTLFFSLGILIYYSHLTTFLTFTIFIGIWLVLNNICLKEWPSGWKTQASNLFAGKSLLPVVLMIAPGIVAMLLYNASIDGPNSFNRLSIEKLIENLFTGRIFITYTHHENLPAVITVFSTFLMFGAALASPRKNYSNPGLINISANLLLTILALLVMYFALPDGINISSLLSLRFLLLLHVFTLLWICTKKIPPLIICAGSFIITITTFYNNSLFANNLGSLNTEAYEYYKLGEKIQPGSFVHFYSPVNEWYLAHYNNYVSYKNLPIILNNYEFGTKAFPLKLNEKFEKQYLKKYQLVPGLYNWHQKLSLKPFDYLIITGHQYKEKLQEVNAFESLVSNYELVQQEGNKFLFKKRN